MIFPFENDIVLENDFVLLRPLASTDTDNLLPAASSDRKLIQYSPAEIYTPELLQQYITNFIADRDKGTRYAFSIFDKKQNEYAGSTSFLNISEVNKRMEIGSTWIAPRFQRTGLNWHCKLLLLTYAFEVLPTERIELQTDERNINSQRAIERIGAKYEGTFRSYITMLDGFRRNSMFYSIIRPEWSGVKEHLNKLIANRKQA